MALVLVGSLVGFAGCGSGSAESAAQTAATASAGASSGSTDSPGAKVRTVSPSGLASVPVLPGAQGAIGDLADQQCNVGRGRQTARARITSSAQTSTNYLVTVSWTTTAGDVLARGYDRVVQVAPGETKNIAIKSTVPSGAGRCVWGAERADHK